MIFPSATAIAPFRIIGPAAVMMLTLRITSGVDGKRVYVLGKGSAFGNDVDPRPLFAAAESLSLTGDGRCEPAAGLQADSAMSAIRQTME
jgi:hypothetical protein